MAKSHSRYAVSTLKITKGASCQEKKRRPKAQLWRLPLLPDLRRADVSQELADFGLQPVGVVRKHLRRREHLRRSRAGLGCAALHVGDVGRDLLGALGRLLHVAGDLLG